MASIPLLSARNLSYRRGGRFLLQDLSFHLLAGEALIVQGSNGAGKTSLLQYLAGIPDPCPNVYREKQITQTYVGHLNALKPFLTVGQNLSNLTLIPLQALEPKLETLGLSPLFDYKIRTLSAGQQRQVALARLVLMNSLLWIVDEPTTHLDAIAENRFWTQVSRHLGTGGIAVISAHGPFPLPQAKVLTLHG